jgi:hypothetical protein
VTNSCRRRAFFGTAGIGIAYFIRG